jgi:hypothetical protein
LQESNRGLQVKQEGIEKPDISIPQPEIMDFKVKTAEIKSFAKVLNS